MLDGLNIAMTTPLDDDGHVDSAAFLRHCTAALEIGASGFVIMGKTGEGRYLGAEHTRALLQVAIPLGEQYGVSVVLCVLKDNNEEVTEQIRIGDAFRVNGYLVAPLMGVRETYERTAELTERPVIAYNNPEHKLSVDELVELNEQGLIAAVKDSDSYPKLVGEFASKFSKSKMPIRFLQGNDRFLHYALSELVKMGGNYQFGIGSISGAASFPPIASVEMKIYKAIKEGERSKAAALQSSLNGTCLAVLSSDKNDGESLVEKYGEAPIIKTMINVMDHNYPINISEGHEWPDDNDRRRMRVAAQTIRRQVSSGVTAVLQVSAGYKKRLQNIT